MHNLYGSLLRRERLRHNLSQEDLCRGICVPSYLSKIEQGQADPSPDVLTALFAALGLTLETDEGFLSRARAALDALFDALRFLQEPEASASFMRENLQRLFCSALHVDAALAALLLGMGDRDELCAGLSACLPDLTPAQRALFYLGRAQGQTQPDRRLADLRAADQAAPDARTAVCLLRALYETGDYTEALEMAQTAYARGAQEGNVLAMLEAAYLCGTTHANLGQLDAMLRHYDRALHLDHCAGTGLAGSVAYNTGATLLEYHRYEEALPHLLAAQDAGREDCMTLHKLCLAYAALNRPEEAAAALEAARAAVPADAPELTRDMLDLAAFRLRPGYADDPAYAALLERVFASSAQVFHFGFRRFYGFELMALRVRQRRYKEALALSHEFPNFPENIL